MAASDLANWWDQQKSQSEDVLVQWVQDNPQWWVIGVAATVQTSMDLGQGLVDVLRLGQGVSEGGWRGVGSDGLRLLSVLGPLGRAGGVASRFIHTQRLRFAVQVSGVDGPCTFQAVNNAMSVLRGKNLFLTVQDMAAAMGTPIKHLKQLKSGVYELGAWVDELLPFLRQFAKVKEITGLTKLTEIAQLAQRENGVVIFAVRASVRNAKGVYEQMYHSVIAVRRANGRVGYGDYGGKLVNTLEEVISKWGHVRTLELYQSSMSAAVIEGMKLTGQTATQLARGAVFVMQGLTAIESVENGLELAAPAAVAAVPGGEPSDGNTPPSVLKGSFDAFKQRRAGKPVIRLDDIYITGGKGVAPRPDWLTGVRFRLNALGYGAGPINGPMNDRTKRSVLAFQSDYPPLRVDGIPGPRTQAKLVEVCGY